ncbi:MAG: hypothetical protein WBX00_31725 [Isosphaeraceae bacterium]
MILSDREIQAAIRDKNILIDPPPDEALFSSTALDLTLDGVLLRWTARDPGGFDGNDADRSLHPSLRIQTRGTPDITGSGPVISR